MKVPEALHKFPGSCGFNFSQEESLHFLCKGWSTHYLTKDVVVRSRKKVRTSYVRSDVYTQRQLPLHNPVLHSNSHTELNWHQCSILKSQRSYYFTFSKNRASMLWLESESAHFRKIERIWTSNYHNIEIGQSGDEYMWYCWRHQIRSSARQSACLSSPFLSYSHYILYL